MLDFCFKFNISFDVLFKLSDKLTYFNEVIDELRMKKRHDKQPVEEPQI